MQAKQQTGTQSALVITSPSAKPLSKEQKTFNTLIKKIGQRRAKLAEYQDCTQVIHERFETELIPLQEKLLQLNTDAVMQLDQAYSTKKLTKVEKRKVSLMIADYAAAILAVKDDEYIKALYNQHAQTDFDQDEAEYMDQMKSVLEVALGLDLGDDQTFSHDELMQRLKQAMHEQTANEDIHEHIHAQNPKQSKSKAREAARREVEEKQLSQSIRDVYRKLASALHPDRERDPQELQRKTAMMQRVNDAYAKENLLLLLELQLEIEQIDQQHINDLQPERLKHYIKILKNQLAELDQEISHIEFQWAVQAQFEEYERVSPKGLLARFKADIQKLKIDISYRQTELTFMQDLAKFKAMLKYKPSQRRDMEDFL